MNKTDEEKMRDTSIERILQTTTYTAKARLYQAYNAGFQNALTLRREWKSKVVARAFAKVQAQIESDRDYRSGDIADVLQRVAEEMESRGI